MIDQSILKTINKLNPEQTATNNMKSVNPIILPPFQMKLSIIEKPTTKTTKHANIYIYQFQIFSFLFFLLSQYLRQTEWTTFTYFYLLFSNYHINCLQIMFFAFRALCPFAFLFSRTNLHTITMYQFNIYICLKYPYI